MAKRKGDGVQHTWRFGADVVWDDGPIGKLICQASMDIDPIGAVDRMREMKLFTQYNYCAYLSMACDFAYAKYAAAAATHGLNRHKFQELLLKRIIYVLTAKPELVSFGDELKHKLNGKLRIVE